MRCKITKYFAYMQIIIKLFAQNRNFCGTDEARLKFHSISVACKDLLSPTESKDFGRFGRGLDGAYFLILAGDSGDSGDSSS